MEVCADVDPVRTLLVLGPQVTAQCLCETVRDQHNPNFSFLEYKQIVESGIKRCLELEKFPSNEAARRKEMLLLNAYDLEPTFAANKVLESLREFGEYDTWANELAQTSMEYQFDGSASPTLQYIQRLRRDGMRLVYTHYDELIARALGLPVVLTEDVEEARKWSQGFPALLHLHGVFSKPQSLKMDCLCYEMQLGEGRTANIVREQFQSRAVVFFGFDEPFLDPHLPKLLATFANPSTMPSTYPLLLTCHPNAPPVKNGCLCMKMPKSELSSALRVSSTTSLGVAPMNDPNYPVSVKLISMDSRTTKELINVLSHYPNILANVNDEGLVLSLQMSRTSLHRMWAEFLVSYLLTQSFSLVSVHIEGSVLFRILDKSLKIMTTTTGYNTSGQIRVCSPMNNLSLWNPSVTMAAAASLSSLSKLTVPSSVMGGVQFTSAGHTPLQHDKVKRIRSENDGLIYQEGKMKKSNGYLTHQQSAPMFPYIASQGGLLPGSQINLRSQVFAMPGNMPQVYLSTDQRQEPENRKQDGEPARYTKSNHSKEEKGFEKKKHKFIQEARQWSKTLDEKLHTKPESSSSVSTPTAHSPNCSTKPTYLIGSGSQANPTGSGMFTILPHSPISGAVLPSQLPMLGTMQQQPINQLSPKMDGNRILPPISMATPTNLPSEQKFVYMLQDGALIATPIFHERQLMDQEKSEPVVMGSSKSPKRPISPNSDTEILMYSPRKRRRSSSLPLNNLKSPCSSDTSDTTTPPLPHPPALLSVPSPSDLNSEQKLFFPRISSPSAIRSQYSNTNAFFSSGHLMSGHASTPSGIGSMGMMKVDSGDLGDEKEEDVMQQPSSPDNHLHPVPIGRGPIQLWQFLLDLLVSPDKTHMIQWTGNGYEFRIVQPEEIAKLWGARKNKPRMNYDKLSRGLRYYYSKGIMDKVPGKKLTFKYTCDIQKYISQRTVGNNNAVMDNTSQIVTNNSL